MGPSVPHGVSRAPPLTALGRQFSRSTYPGAPCGQTAGLPYSVEAVL